jgi:uncharacterized membrane protein
VLQKVSDPLANRLPEIIFGFDGSKLLAILLLIIVCFFSGLLFRSRRIRKWVVSLEENLLSFLPGYALIKSITSDAVGGDDDHNMTTVLVQDGEGWNIGFLVEENGELCTVFFPEAPKHDSGEVRIVPAATVKKMDVPSNRAARSLNRYGKGALQWKKKE